jgi:SAM-dependent methyltransferase
VHLGERYLTFAHITDPMSSELVDYYRRRANEYEKVYAKEERQADLAVLHEVVPAYFTGMHVLEVACGTGYWTRRVSERASSVIAIDLAPETLAIARQHQTAGNVDYRTGDAFELAAVTGSVDAALVAFWWSHIRHEDLARFLTGLHCRLPSGAAVLVVDNRYVEGSNWPLARTDARGNTYQRRQLENGEEHEVLKNFSTPADVQRAVRSAGGGEAIVHELEYYWYATYTVGTPG